MAIKTKAYDWEGDFGTIAELASWMEKNDVPSDAKIIYEGCGTHNIAFQWNTPEPELTEGYWVTCREVDNPDRVWGWFQEHEPREDEIEAERAENHFREIRITWAPGTKVGEIG